HIRIFGCIILLLLACLSPIAWASSGDRAPEYKYCVETCNLNICENPTLTRSLPLILRLTQWTCLDNCRYECMHKITQRALETDSDKIHQYHGKWPFVRFAGMQEPASVLFSVLNGYMHFRGWAMIRRTVPKTYSMRSLYLGYGLVGMNTWLWSAVYHSRDWPSTEKLDYFSAGISVMYGLFYSVIRVFRMERIQSRAAWATICLVPLLLHIGYLGFVNFDYGYNMIATATVGTLHNLVWVGWSVRNWRRRRSYASMPALWALMITLAMSLELLDFAPLAGLVDAHALWHLATVPLVAHWYRFLAADTAWELGRNGQRKQDAFGSYQE
ncbi:hypothetical protein BGZ94_002697, partial [Podila epigama]